MASDEKAPADVPAKPETQEQKLRRVRQARGEATGTTPGEVVGRDPAYAYAYFVPRDYGSDGRQVAAIRDSYRKRGFEPAGDVFVPGEPGAEVWRVEQAIADDEWKDEFIRNLLNPSWFEMQARRPNHGIAKKVVELAKKSHDLKASPESRQAARGELERHVRKNPLKDLQVSY